MATEIRRATRADAATITLLGHITFAETFGYLFRDHPADLRTYLDATFGVGKIEHSLGKPENAYWLGFKDRLPVGYAKLKHPSAPPGEIEKNAAQLQKIYVLGEFLGERIGAGLLDHVVPEAKRLAPTLWLDVLRENERAIAFYAKHGFAAIGEDTYTIGSKTFLFHLMAKPLT